MRQKYHQHKKQRSRQNPPQSQQHAERCRSQQAKAPDVGPLSSDSVISVSSSIPYEPRSTLAPLSQQENSRSKNGYLKTQRGQKAGKTSPVESQQSVPAETDHQNHEAGSSRHRQSTPVKIVSGAGGEGQNRVMDLDISCIPQSSSPSNQVSSQTDTGVRAVHAKSKFSSLFAKYGREGENEDNGGGGLMDADVEKSALMSILDSSVDNVEPINKGCDRQSEEIGRRKTVEIERAGHEEETNVTVHDAENRISSTIKQRLTMMEGREKLREEVIEPDLFTEEARQAAGRLVYTKDGCGKSVPKKREGGKAKEKSKRKHDKRDMTAGRKHRKSFENAESDVPEFKKDGGKRVKRSIGKSVVIDESDSDSPSYSPIMGSEESDMSSDFVDDSKVDESSVNQSRSASNKRSSEVKHQSKSETQNKKVKVSRPTAEQATSKSLKTDKGKVKRKRRDSEAKSKGNVGVKSLDKESSSIKETKQADKIAKISGSTLSKLKQFSFSGSDQDDNFSGSVEAKKSGKGSPEAESKEDTDGSWNRINSTVHNQTEDSHVGVDKSQYDDGEENNEERNKNISDGCKNKNVAGNFTSADEKPSKRQTGQASRGKAAHEGDTKDKAEENRELSSFFSRFKYSKDKPDSLTDRDSPSLSRVKPDSRAEKKESHALSLEQGKNAAPSKDMNQASTGPDQTRQGKTDFPSKPCFNTSECLGDEDDLFEFDEDCVQDASPFFVSKVQEAEKMDNSTVKPNVPTANKFLKFVKISSNPAHHSSPTLTKKPKNLQNTLEKPPPESSGPIDKSLTTSNISSRQIAKNTKQHEHLLEDQPVLQKSSSRECIKNNLLLHRSDHVPPELDKMTSLSQLSQKSSSSQVFSQKQSFRNFKFTKLKSGTEQPVSNFNTESIRTSVDLPMKTVKMSAAPERLLHSQSSHGDNSQPPGSVPYMGIGSSPTTLVSQNIVRQNSNTCIPLASSLALDAGDKDNTKKNTNAGSFKFRSVQSNCLESNRTDTNVSLTHRNSEKNVHTSVDEPNHNMDPNTFLHRQTIFQPLQNNSQLRVTSGTVTAGPGSTLNTKGSKTQAPAWLSRLKNKSGHLSSTPLSSSSSATAAAAPLNKFISQAQDLSDGELDDLLDVDL